MGLVHLGWKAWEKSQFSGFWERGRGESGFILVNAVGLEMVVVVVACETRSENMEIWGFAALLIVVLACGRLK